MNFNKTTIGEHCCITSSKRFHASERTNEGIPFYCSKEIIQKVNGEDVLECDYISTSAYKTVKEKFGAPQPGDLLITTRGTYGVPYIYKESDEFYFADGNLTWLKDFDEELDAEYLYYWVNTHEGQKKIDAIAKGTAQKAVPIATLKTIELQIPDIGSQKKIVDILKKYDSLIENSKKQIKLLEEAAQRLYKEWFVDLRFPGYEECNIIDGLPEGWKKTILDEIFSYERGKSYTSKELSDSEGIALVNLKNIQAWGGYKREAEKRFTGKFKESQTVKFGDIVMAVTDMTQERRLVGHVALIPNLGEKATYSMDLIKLMPCEGINSFFLYSSLRYSGIAENISKHANGTNVLHLKPDSVMGLEYVLPSKELRDSFGSMMETICKKIEVLQNQIISLNNARDRLLPKLMNGEIEV